MKCSYTTLFHKFSVVWLDSINLVFYGYVLIILAICARTTSKMRDLFFRIQIG
jgi:hypothetical protein